MIQTVLIAGAGIAGLATAIALRQHNIGVTVLERASELTTAGAGLQLHSCATRVLYALGLRDALDSIGSVPAQIDFREAHTGRLVIRGAPNNSRREFPHFQVHRADLQQVMLQRAAELGVQLEFDAVVQYAAQDDNSAWLTLADGRRLDADAIVGADGIGSVVRQQLFGNDQPQFTGNVAYRATIAGQYLKHPISAGVYMGRDAHMVIYPLRNGECVNVVAQQRCDNWAEELWTSPGDVDDLRRRYQGWHDDVDAVLAAMSETWKWALYTRPAMPAWSVGRIGLVGDACHSSLPNLGAGAALALEDGFVLAELLASGGDDIAGALSQLHRLRIDRCTRVQRGSQKNARLFHLRNPILRWCTYRSLALATSVVPGLVQRQLAWLQDHDATKTVSTSLLRQ